MAGRVASRKKVGASGSLSLKRSISAFFTSRKKDKKPNTTVAHHFEMAHRMPGIRGQAHESACRMTCTRTRGAGIATSAIDGSEPAPRRLIARGASARQAAAPGGRKSLRLRDREDRQDADHHQDDGHAQPPHPRERPCDEGQQDHEPQAARSCQNEGPPRSRATRRRRREANRFPVAHARRPRPLSRGLHHSGAVHIGHEAAREPLHALQDALPSHLADTPLPASERPPPAREEAAKEEQGEQNEEERAPLVPMGPASASTGKAAREEDTSPRYDPDAEKDPLHPPI